jgi:hypothetical protein
MKSRKVARPERPERASPAWRSAARCAERTHHENRERPARAGGSAACWWKTVWSGSAPSTQRAFVYRVLARSPRCASCSSKRAGAARWSSAAPRSTVARSRRARRDGDAGTAAGGATHPAASAARQTLGHRDSSVTMPARQGARGAPCTTAEVFGTIRSRSASAAKSHEKDRRGRRLLRHPVGKIKWNVASLPDRDLVLQDFGSSARGRGAGGTSGAR